MSYDYSKPIEIAPNIWWVGYVIPNDPFQCHVYLIENGDESILIDPGSMITFPVTLEKIVQITPLRNIKYIIMHHQDPDIVGCYSTLESIMPKRDDRRIVTHWRTWMLLKHYQWNTPFYLVDKEGWKLKAGERELEFVFTPYAHFAGAICTYDKKSGILFSSDIFGGLTDKFSLFADKHYLNDAKLFHKHYMPHKTILNYALKKIEEKHPKMIAPQHGSIIKEDLVQYMIDGLKDLDCGLYLLDDYVDDVFILNQVDEILKAFIESLIINEPFEEIIKKLYKFLHYNISLSSLKVETDYFKCSIDENDLKDVKKYAYDYDIFFENKKLGKIIFEFEKKLSDKDVYFLNILTKKLSLPLGASLYRYLQLKKHEEKEKVLYEKSIKDPLTGLYNRNFLYEFLEKKIKEAKRYKFPLTLAVIDIDFFKKINDTYGHLVGDCVLKELAKILTDEFRGSDIVVRFGGEEFIVILPFSDLKEACSRFEELRKKIEEKRFCDEKLNVTVSIGATEFKQNDSLDTFIDRADKNLYEAKNKGRNRVVCS